MLSLIKAQKKQRKTSPDIKRGKLLALVLRVVLASACAPDVQDLVQDADRAKPASRGGGLVYLRPTASLARVLAL